MKKKIGSKIFRVRSMDGPPRRPFAVEYLWNRWKFWHAVFARFSRSIFSTFWPIFVEIVRVVSEKSGKNLYFDRFSWILRRTGFFSENPTVSVSSPHWCLTSCKVSEISFEPFTKNVHFPFHPHHRHHHPHPRTAMIAIPLRAISGRGVKKGKVWMGIVENGGKCLNWKIRKIMIGNVQK